MNEFQKRVDHKVARLERKVGDLGTCGGKWTRPVIPGNISGSILLRSHDAVKSSFPRFILPGNVSFMYPLLR